MIGEDVRQCLRAGMDAHMSKPVDIDILKAKLAELLSAQADHSMIELIKLYP